jgi:hypothetical protein
MMRPLGIVVVGALIGMPADVPLLVIAAVTPSVLYEVYRTEGESTRWASWALLGALILETVFLVFGVSFDVGQFLGNSQQDVAGYQVPLGDVKLVGPALAGVCALVLLARTRGRYTKWLAVNIIVAMVALAYTIDSGALTDLIGMGLN